MTARMSDPGARRRLIIVGVLTVCAVALMTLHLTGALRPGPTDSFDRAVSARIGAVIDSLLTQYGIDPRSGKTWHVQTPAKKTIRVEQRVPVPPEFVSVSFNHDLQGRLESLGVRVFATERTLESIVTLYILKDGAIIRSLTLVTKADRPE